LEDNDIYLAYIGNSNYRWVIECLREEVGLLGVASGKQLLDRLLSII